jgi:hypothetical protein
MPELLDRFHNMDHWGALDNENTMQNFEHRSVIITTTHTLDIYTSMYTIIQCAIVAQI